MPPTDNNSFSTATSITNLIGTPPLSGLLNASDKTDFYKFTLIGSSSTSVTLTELTGNARLRLFNSPTDSNPITASNPKQLSEALSVTLATGTYYIQVDLDSSDAAATDANYKLNLSVSTNSILSNLVWRSTVTGTPSVVQTDGKTVQADSGIKFGGTSVSVPTSDWKSQFADFNGDGEDDILWRNQKDGTVAIWLMKGDTILQAVTSPYKVSADWQATLGDFNNDNHADIFWRNKQSGSTAIWLTNSAGLGFDTFTLLPGVSSDWDPALGDFNKDGKKDIFWRNSKSSEVAIWLMNGTQIIPGGAAFLPSVSSAWKSQLGDFNKDGRTDIFWRNTQTGEAAVWLLNGTQIAPGGAAFLPNVPIEWTAQIGDFDGNKADDLLWRNNQTGQLAVWLLDGTQIATGGAAYLSYTLPARFNIEQLTDFNNDGKADLFLRDPASGEVAVWLLNGTSILGAAFLPQRSTGDQFDGVQRRRFVSTTRSIGGGTELSAFNIGTLNAAGVYADSIDSTVPDYFKFKLAIQSTLVYSVTDPNSQPLNSVQLNLYKAGVNGTASTLVNYAAGQTLDPGDYYIKVSTNLDGINYRLNVEGKPQFTDLTGNAFTTSQPQVVLMSGAATGTDPVTTISVNYSAQSVGTIAANGVKVAFYISRDQILDASDFLMTTTTTVDLPAGQSSQSQSLTLSLPSWKNNFWTVDGTYYLLAFVDSNNAFPETNESNNVTVLNIDVQQIPTINLRGKSLSVNGTTFAPTGTVAATFVTEDNGFYAASNGSYAGFYLSTTPVFNKTDTSAWSFNPSGVFVDPIASKSSSAPQTVSLSLPPRNWTGWANLSGTQKLYIGMIQNVDIGVNDVDPTDNQNRGQGIDWVEIMVNLS